MQLSYKLYLTTGNLSKNLRKESIEGHWRSKNCPNCQFAKELTLNTLKNIHIDEACELFCECVSVKSSKHEFISNSALTRQQKHSNYKSLDSYSQVDGKSMGSERHHSNLPKDDFTVKYMEALDLIMASIRTRFNQPSFIAFSLI